MSLDPYGLGIWIEMDQGDIDVWELVNLGPPAVFVWDREYSELMELEN